MASSSSATPAPAFPTHNAPRVWLITSGDSPIGISLARRLLDHGDYVVTGIIPSEFEKDGCRSEELKAFLAEVGERTPDGWKDRLRIVSLDVRYAFTFWQRNGELFDLVKPNAWKLWLPRMMLTMLYFQARGTMSVRNRNCALIISNCAN